MPLGNNWADKYKDSDHHIDRQVRTIINIQNVTGNKYTEPAPALRSRMARGRGGYGGDVIVETRAGNPSSRASRISAYTIEDTDQMQSASKRQDKALMRDITSRLYKLEFESVKPSFNVAMKTGFRRKMYHKKLPAIGKEAKEEFHKNRLKYPWDYTNDNLYRSTPKKKKTKKEEVKDQAEGDPYPEYDPLGLYRPRPKRERNPMPEASAAAERYEKMSPREILSDLRVKTFSKPRFRDPSDDISNLLEQISRPLPQSEVKEYVPATGDIYDFEPTIPADEKCMDPAIGKKIEASKGEIAEFERMLDRFAKKTVKPRIPPPPVFVPAAARPLHLEGSGSEDELDLEAGASFTKPVEVRSTRRYVPVPYTISDVPELPMTSLRVIAKERPQPSFYPSHPISISVVKPPPVAAPVATLHAVRHPYVGLPLKLYPRRFQASSYYRSPYYSHDDLDIRNFHRRHYRSYAPKYSYDDIDLLPHTRYSRYSRDRYPYLYGDINMSDYQRQLVARLYRPYYYGATDPSLDLYTKHHYRPTSVYGGLPLSYYRHPYAYDDLDYPDYHIYRSHLKRASPSPIYEPWDRAVSEPPRRSKASGSTGQAVRNARRYLYRIERELGLDYPDIDDYEPPHIVPRSALTTHASARQAPVGAIRRTPHLSTPKSRYREIEARVEAMGDPVIGYQPTPDSLTSLRSRTANAKSKMDHHKVLLDRYLPVSMGPVSAVEYEVEDKYGELAARMPVLEQYRRSEPITGSMGYVTPYKPAARARAGSLDSSVPRASGTRPPVSETRRRAREVLCKTKGDPNYYSY